jgi:protein TonB
MQAQPIRVTSASSDEPWLAPIVTLVLWLGCALIGILGFVLPYLRPVATGSIEPMRLEMLNIELTDEILGPADPLTPADPVAEAMTPPPPDVFVPPLMTELIAVAQPSPSIAFALPVEGPVRVVDAGRADYAVAAANTNAVIVAPVPQPLSFGQGQGRRLRRPEYPIRARREGQEGTVAVRFRVGENRRVLSVELQPPSPWPLLNESVERTAREYWHGVLEPGFSELSVQFQIRR